MKIKPFFLAIILGLTGPVSAQNVTYACQYIKAGGLVWEQGNWKSVEFRSPQPFFLSALNGQLLVSSVAKALGAAGVSVECQPVNYVQLQSCSSAYGETFIFNFDTQQGANSAILGASQAKNDKRKDTLFVAAFTCSKVN